MKLNTNVEIAVTIDIRVVDVMGDARQIIYQERDTLCHKVDEIVCMLEQAIKDVKRRLSD